MDISYKYEYFMRFMYPGDWDSLSNVMYSLNKVTPTRGIHYYVKVYMYEVNGSSCLGSEGAPLAKIRGLL